MFDPHGERRCAGLVHCDQLDIMGTRSRLRCVAHWVGKTLGHAVDGAAVLVDRWFRAGVHGRPRTSCLILLGEPDVVCGGQAIARSSSVDGEVGPQQEWQLVVVGCRVGVHYSVWAPGAESVLRGPAFSRRAGLLHAVVAGGWGGAQA